MADRHIQPQTWAEEGGADRGTPAAAAPLSDGRTGVYQDRGAV